MSNSKSTDIYSHRLILEMVYNITFWLNALPHRDGVHNIMS